MSEDSITQTIVLVDDEEMVLTSISSLISLDTDYQCVTFLSTGEALDYISNNEQ